MRETKGKGREALHRTHACMLQASCRPAFSCTCKLAFIVAACYHSNLPPLQNRLRVQVRLCPKHALQLNYRKNRQVLRAQHKERKRQLKRQAKQERKRHKRKKRAGDVDGGADKAVLGDYGAKGGSDESKGSSDEEGAFGSKIIGFGDAEGGSRGGGGGSSAAEKHSQQGVLEVAQPWTGSDDGRTHHDAMGRDDVELISDSAMIQGLLL